jgi:hypothetical protein
VHRYVLYTVRPTFPLLYGRVGTYFSENFEQVGKIVKSRKILQFTVYIFIQNQQRALVFLCLSSFKDKCIAICFKSHTTGYRSLMLTKLFDDLGRILRRVFFFLSFKKVYETFLLLRSKQDPRTEEAGDSLEQRSSLSGTAHSPQVPNLDVLYCASYPRDFSPGQRFIH